MYPVVVQVTSQGYTNTDISFTYRLVINSISKVEGSYGGGLSVTLSGDGFADSNTLVTICNNTCEIIPNGSNSSTIQFKVLLFLIVANLVNIWLI